MARARSQHRRPLRRGRAARASTVALLVVAVAGCSTSGGSATTTSAEPTLSPSTSTSGPGPTTTTGYDDCAASGPEGDNEMTVDVGGQRRTYLVHVPRGLRGPAPLVLTAHGLGSTARQQLAYSDFGPLADREGFIVAAPQAQGTPTTWNFLQAASVPTSDAAYLQAVLDDIAGRWCIDPTRRYLTGISNGSALTFAAACAGSFGFAAYGGVAGAFWSDRCAGAPSTPMIYFHGTDDPVVPFDGGRALFAPVAPARQSLHGWADHDGCDPARTEEVADHVTLLRWTGCRDGAEVAFYEIAGGGHTWPGSPVDAPLLGSTTHEISASALMWDFFVRHPAR